MPLRDKLKHRPPPGLDPTSQANSILGLVGCRLTHMNTLLTANFMNPSRLLPGRCLALGGSYTHYAVAPKPSKPALLPPLFLSAYLPLNTQQPESRRHAKPSASHPVSIRPAGRRGRGCGVSMRGPERRREGYIHDTAHPSIQQTAT